MIEMVPFYLCKEPDTGICPETQTECYVECHHTSFPLNAAHPESVDIFNKFCDTFDLMPDEDGRVYVVEKEKNND